MWPLFALIVSVNGATTYGNIFSDSYAHSQLMVIPPGSLLGGPSESCIHLPHTYFYTGSVFLPRIYSTIKSEVRFMTIGGGVVDVEHSFYDDKCKFLFITITPPLHCQWSPSTPVILITRRGNAKIERARIQSVSSWTRFKSMPI